MKFTAVFPGSHPISVGDAIVGTVKRVYADVDDGKGGLFERLPSIILHGDVAHEPGNVADILEADFRDVPYGPPPDAFIRIGDRLVHIDLHVSSAGCWKADEAVTVSIDMRVRDASSQLALWTQPALRAIGATVNA